jgi:DnaJ-class molecular chaperone
MAERRAAYRTVSLRWHPDKFMQGFGAQLALAERDHVLQRVTAVSQTINALFQEAADVD